MTQKITETVERWCCEPRDLVVDELHKEGIHGERSEPHLKPGTRYNQWRYLVCKHCGQRFEYHSFTDAAGSSDWDYREMK